MTKKVLILCPYPFNEAPSQRFRFEQQLSFLKSNGINITQKSFLDTNSWHILYKPGNVFQKLFGILNGFLRRIVQTLSVKKHDSVFIHREASPIGPPIFEWLIAKIFRVPIIYDFDDAIWLENTSQQNTLARCFKYNRKVGKICSWSSQCWKSIFS